ncbi:MAG TPA: sulfatase [Thermoanaerobaculia bacterium]|nr:sulfatase [Thermoanaerobaculia bacterium]
MIGDLSFRHRLHGGLRLAVSATLVLLLASACGPEPAETATAIQERWIAEDPEVVFDPAESFERIVRFEWLLGAGDEWSAFRVVNHEGGLRRTREGVEVPFAPRFLKLQRPADFEARDVQAVEVEISGAERGHLQLFWSGAGEPYYSPERMIQVPVQGAPVVTFDVSAHPRWQGAIRHLSVTPTTAPGQTVVVRAIRGIQRRIDPDTLVGLVARPWKVELDDDLRNALLAPPGLALVKTLDVPRGSRLRLAFGVLPRAAEPVAFRVAVRSGEAEPVALLERRLEAASEPGWTEAEIDLAPYAGRRVTLMLETTAEDTDLARRIPVWANPEVVAPAGAATRPNIILVSIDTLRADRMSAYGHSRPTTPGLEAWVRDTGVRFEKVVAPSPWTLPSHVSLFSGLDAARHGVNFAAPAGPSVVTLAERLRAGGYSTAAFTAGAYLNPEFGLAQGFDVFRARQEAPSTEDVGELERGIAEVRAWLAEAPATPFFLFFHTYEVHVPYRARSPYFEQFGGDPSRLPPGLAISTRKVAADERDGFLDRKQFVFTEQRLREGVEIGAADQDLVGLSYDSGIAAMDHHVSRLFADLASLGLDSDTVVVLTSDHGEMLGEHGLAAHGYLYDENLLVPLLLSLPGGRRAGTVVPDQVRLIDVFPTLLELAGLEAEPGIDGQSLLPLLADSAGGQREVRHREAWSYAASSNHGLSLRHADRWKYIFRNAVWPPTQGKEELYDLRRDPREGEDLAASSGRSAGLRAEVRKYLESRAAGLRVRFTNSGTSTLVGTLSGPMVKLAGVTSHDLSCPCLRWLGGQSLRFEVPPGEEITVNLEQAGSERLVIAGELADGAGGSFRHTVDAGRLERSLELAHDGSRWVRGTTGVAAAAGPSAVRIRFWWQGERRFRGETPVEDAELQEQLRALGYLN